MAVSGGTGLGSLNEAQKRAVTSSASTVAILAGPGSGKTHTLTSRVVWLINHVGYQPGDVIVATFTVKAAREMKERLDKHLGRDCEAKVVLGTFHSIARRYLVAYGKRIGLNPKFGIADDGDSRAILQRIIKRHNLQVEPSYAKAWISKKKAKGTTPEPKSQPSKKRQEPPALDVCFDEYQEHLARANLLDYDDLLVKCVELLQDHPSCVSNVQAVLIDEYQDTNGIQYDLMRLFAQARRRITIVGDPDQSIYGWRSAEVKNLYRLLRDYPDTDEIALQENYRSSQQILEISLQVIQQDTNRYKKILLPVHAKCTKPVLRKLKSSSAEGEWIVSELRRVTTMFGGALKNEDIAILLRSASLSRHVESALGKAGIPYRMIGGHKFYERKEVKILLDYLRVVYQPDNNDAVARIINVPRRGIGEATIKSLMEEAEQAEISLWTLLWRHCRGGRQATTKIRPNMEQKLNTELLRIITTLRPKSARINESDAMTLVDLIEQLVNLLHFKAYLEMEYPDDHEHRWANVQELLSLANDFVRDFGQADEDALPEVQEVEQEKDTDVLGRFLSNVALASDAQSDEKQQDKTSLVTISTIHAAKGLEWPVVFVPSVYEGSIPHSRAEDMGEERRLLYVAMTRAKALLYLSCPLYGSQGLSNKVELSPFVSPIADAFHQKGPSLDRRVMESVGKILGRAIPTETRIFGQIAPMFCLEDDLFPIDPFDPKGHEGPDFGSSGRNDRPNKRQRTQTGSGGGDEVPTRPWHPGYATTMEQSDGFTMASLPGFVTAGAHRTTLAAAAAASKTASPLPNDQINGPAGGRRGTTGRKPDQGSLLTFVKTDLRLPAPAIDNANARDLSFARHQAAMVRAAQRATPLDFSLDKNRPVIEPEHAGHKIIGAKRTARTNSAPSSEAKSDAKRYACFSSSPAREASPETAPGELQRPATSFHSTTFMSVKPASGAIRRPVGLGPPPSMDRLRKPFKPLTINRPPGQPNQPRGPAKG
ncbi:DNA helicase, UvrD/REP type [Moelleriella libera RCEF 2490]|uniref:DNA 3'-5' helicase n=1 Tax=Moelleriella libera RCEF 2490 TaxID=1081109 RepID=A0A168D946_9HYPO|nr:DNA helicase, UvrD/REP type [Moelleriella libera RCEF 2490]